MGGRSYTFSQVIVRAPGQSIVSGLRAQDLGSPDLKVFLSHHADYVDALKSTGAKVMELPALEAFPDAVFIEDAALCLPEGAVVMRPGAPSRLGEAKAIEPVLQGYYSKVSRIAGPGCIEGGDILTTETEILVGRSARTDAAGVAELRGIVEGWGYRLRELQTPPDVLHFKTDCSLLDGETILCTRRLAATGCFDGYKIIFTADGEEACANAIRYNNLVIMPAGFPKTAAAVSDAGFEVGTVGNSEAAKLDGGMSCLSLRFSPS